MNTEEIQSTLAKHGFKQNALYHSNQEYVDNLIALQSGLAALVCDESQKDSARVKDIVSVVSALAEETGVNDSREFVRFQKSMKTLSSSIVLNIAGIVGEKQGFRALRPFEFERDTVVMHNIYFDDGESATEIDAILICSYGIFIIEIKNCKVNMIITPQGFFQKVTHPTYRYPLGERMGCKELLVRQAIGDGIDVPVIPVLLYINDSSRLFDEFGKIQVSYRNTIVYDIKSHRKDGRVLSDSQIEQVSSSIKAHSVEAVFPCETDLDGIVNNFAALMTLIESAKCTHSNVLENGRFPQGLARGMHVANCITSFISSFFLQPIRTTR